MDGARLPASGCPHFSSRQTRLLQPGRFMGRRTGAAVGTSIKPLEERLSAHRSDAPLPKYSRRVTSWSALARAATEFLAIRGAYSSERPENPAKQTSEEASPPAIRLQKLVSSSDRCPGPWRARRKQGSPE